MRRTVLLSLGLIVLPLLLNGAGTAAAQSADITNLLSGRGSSAVAPSAQSTPRRTMTKFLDAMNDVRAGQTQRLDEALACLYLGELTQEERAAQSESIASRLFEIIDHEGVQLDTFPDVEEGADYTAITTGAGPITLHRYEDGLWRFNSRTVARAVEMHKAVVGDAAGGGGGLDSPREALRTFVEGMERGDEAGRQEAVLALELPEDKSAEETAFILYQVLIRFPKVVYQEISTPAGDLPFVYPLDGSDYQLVIAPVAPDGQWKFTAESLTGLWDLYRRVAARPVLWRNVAAANELPSVRMRLWVSANLPFLLKRTVLLENWQVLGLFVIILTGFLISRLVCFGISTGLRHWFRRATYALDPAVEKKFLHPIHIALMAWVWFVGLSVLGLPDKAHAVLRQGAESVSAAGVIWAFYRMIDILGSFLVRRAESTETKFDDLLIPLITRSLKVFVIAFGLVFVAETLQLPVTSLVAGLGIGGLAFALAAKDTVENIFGSLTVLLDRPFHIGDWVVIGEVEGMVETVGMRSTRIRTFYNSLITMPNSKLISAVVDNMGQRRYRRYSTMISIAYNTPPDTIEAFCEGIRKLVQKHPYTRKDYYHVYLNQFGASSLDILLYVFHEVPDWGTELRERQRLCLDIVRLAQRLGVEFAYPTQTLYMKRGEDPIPAQGVVPPHNADEAFRLGRREAERILKECGTVGKTPPPPVTFPVGGDIPDDDGAVQS